ncbi:hypothetical protein JOB18_043521 [Solea senegalensis]|uniref:Uncharacterized protein n=1 Tax=Solea senegalensis TaxID=28829 RepID=A0AAV6QZA5_SOLSE|nr:hypothetical protein JOB18_043521 [Solea senegalensis]
MHTFITARHDSAIMNPATPHVCGGPLPCTSIHPSIYLSLGAGRLTWHPLPNPQSPGETTHVRQHRHKLVEEVMWMFNVAPCVAPGGVEVVQ